MPSILPGLTVLLLVTVGAGDAAAQPYEFPLLPEPRPGAAEGPVTIEEPADAFRAAAGEDAALLFHVAPIGPESDRTLLVRTALGAIELSAIALEAAITLCTQADGRLRGKAGGEPAPGSAPGLQGPGVPLPVLALDGLKDAMIDLRIIPLIGSGLPRAPDTCGAPGLSCDTYRVEFRCTAENAAR